MAENSLNAIYLGNAFNIDTDPVTGFVGTTFSRSNFYETTVNFTGLAASGSQSINEDGVTPDVQIDVPGGDTGFQDLQEVNQYQIRIVSQDGAGGTVTSTVSAQVFQTADGHLFLVPTSADAANFPTGTYNSIEILNFQAATTDLVIRDSSGADMDVPAGVAPPPDGVVDGTTGPDSMQLGFADAGGDQITLGDDSIVGGGGADNIEGSGGNDTIDGGAGNDRIYGDSANNSVRESLNWENLTTAQVQDGVTINTGAVNVTFSSPTETGITLETIDNSSPYTGGVVDDGEGVDPNSVLAATAAGSDVLGQYNWVFSEQVTDVSFNITDLDGFENIQILAYDANGVPVDVVLTPGSNVSVSDSNGDGFDDLAVGSGSGGTGDASQAVTVSIAGPVSRIEAIHTTDNSGTLGIHFTEEG